MPNERTIQQNNLDHLTKEIYKFVNGLYPPIIKSFSRLDKNFKFLYSYNKATVKFGTETITYRDTGDHKYGLLF